MNIVMNFKLISYENVDSKTSILSMHDFCRFLLAKNLTKNNSLPLRPYFMALFAIIL